MSEKQGDQKAAAQKAWDEWHVAAGFDQDDDDDYVPTMPPLWEIAFSAGAQWALEQVGDE